MADLNSPVGAPAPRLSNEQFPFAYGPQGYSLSSGQAHITAKHARKAASACLVSALQATLDVVHKTGSDSASHVALLIEMSQVAVAAATSSQFPSGYSRKRYLPPSDQANKSANSAMDAALNFLAYAARIAASIAYEADSNSAGLVAHLVELSQLAVAEAIAAAREHHHD